MFKTKADAAKFARGLGEFFDSVWDPKAEWTEAYFAETHAKNVQHTWQGQTCDGIKGMLEHWTPMKGAFVHAKTLGEDIETFTDTMVSYMHYAVCTSFENKEVFIVTRCIVDVDKEGKVLRETYVLDQKYANAMMGVMGAFAEKNGIKMT